MVPAVAPALRLTTCLHMPLSDDIAMLTCMVLAVACSCATAALLSTRTAAAQRGIVHTDSSVAPRLYADSGSTRIAVF